MSHMISSLEFFTEPDLEVKNQIFLADGKSITAEGIGFGCLNCRVQLKGASNIFMKKCLVCPRPRWKSSIFEAPTSSDFTAQFPGTTVRFKKGTEIIIIGIADDFVYQRRFSYQVRMDTR